MTLDTTNPDLHALIVTIGHARELTQTNATPDQWQALTDTLTTEHTAAELANMLTGAAALIARSDRPDGHIF